MAIPSKMSALLKTVVDNGASDLHITADSSPRIRVQGELRTLDMEPLTKDEAQNLIFGVLTEKQRGRFERDLELDYAYSVPGFARFRVNVYMQKGSVSANFRLIPQMIESVSELGLPSVINKFADLPRGLILVTGPTGSGKTTTLAALINRINKRYPYHIITIEDPIEFVHKHDRCFVSQREVGEDTKGFAEALRSSLRQDPDVILVGEMRDLDTIQTAITAAETGHLVFATLHTQDATQSVDRIIDVFPHAQQEQIRIMLADTLQGIVSQILLPMKDGTGRVAATEVLFMTSAIRSMIREANTHQIGNALQTGAKFGMQTMDSSLAQLVKDQKVDKDVAETKAKNKEEFASSLSGVSSFSIAPKK